MQARDAWIDWSDQQRQRNLQGIVNHSRFLILHWVHAKGLASKILANRARQMPHDWQTHLWSPSPAVGNPGGWGAFFRDLLSSRQLDLSRADLRRGRMDREHKSRGEAVKDIYVYPFIRNALQLPVRVILTVKKYGRR